MSRIFLQANSLSDSLSQNLNKASDSLPISEPIKRDSVPKMLTDSLSLNLTEKTIGENGRVLWSITQEQADYVWKMLIKYGFNILEGIGIFIIGYWIAKKLSQYLYRLMVKRRVDPSVRVFLRDLVYIILIILVFFIALSSAGIPLNLATVIGGTALGIVISLQGGISNFAGGLMIITLKPFKVGDLIEAQNHIGYVEKINLLNTSIKTVQHQIVILPNGPFFKIPLVNHSAKDKIRIDITTKINYQDDFKLIKDAIYEKIMEDKMFLDYLPVTVEIEHFAESYMELTVRAFTKVVNYFEAPLRLHSVVRECMIEQNMEFPVPQRDVKINKEE